MKKIELSKVYLGDCLDLMKPLPPKSIDLILCDLPYGTTQCKWDVIIPFDKLWEQYKRIIKNNGAIVLFSAQPFTTDLINSNRKMFRYEIVWGKTQVAGFLNAKKMPLRTHENICVFYKHLPTYNPQMTTVGRSDVGMERKNSGRGQQYNEFRNENWSWVETGKRYPTDIIHFSNWNGALFGNTENATQHPTQKPVDLCEYLIQTFSNEGDTVLDNCAGSMTTGIACRNTGRNYILMEKDPIIYADGLERLKTYSLSTEQFDNCEIKDKCFHRKEMKKIELNKVYLGNSTNTK